VAAVRILVMIAALAGLGWFQFLNTASASEVSRSALDLFDPRPARDILFVGNSRMYVNGMPAMVRRIADSADSPVKYRVRMWARPGADFVDHARNDRLRGLLDQRWDRVILQGQSASHWDDEDRSEFATHGTWLAERAGQAGSPVSLVINWNYGDALYQGHPPGTRAAHYRAIQHDYRALARRTDAALIDVGTAWKRMEGTNPGFPLTTDGNHPSVHGTYLYALTVYAHVAGGGIARVRYVPDGVSPAEAAAIRATVDDHLRSGIDAPPPPLTR
jgi:hypothetical protein